VGAHTWANWTEALSHCTVGGVGSVLQGGKFGHGFVSGGMTKLVNVTGWYGSDQGISHTIARTAIAAMIGGTISEVTGGKFASGARTAALAQLFNGEREVAREDAEKGSVGEGIDEMLDAARRKARGYRVHANERNSVIGVEIVLDKDGDLSLSPASHRIPVDGVYANPNIHAPTVLDVDATKAIYVLETSPHEFYQKGYYGRDYQVLSNIFKAT